MSTYIVCARRTPFGKFKGQLSSIPAHELAAIAIRACINTLNKKIKLEDIDECLVGQVLTAGTGQAPAKQTALAAGLPASVPCTSINKVCGSGLKSIMLACDSIELKRAQMIFAGGQENMSLAPHLLTRSRLGMPLGDLSLIDSLMLDGLINPYDKKHMGSIGEICANTYQLSREEQDDFAKRSYERALKAQKNLIFKDEIAPVILKLKKGKTQTIDQDEQISQTDYDRISTARPVFEKNGTITAGNASKINDGACFLFLASQQAVDTYQLPCLAKIIGQNTFSQKPHDFTTAPARSIQNLLKQLDYQIKDIDLFEINEAFSVVPLAVSKILSIPQNKINIHGGAIALGHPIGASGARILTTLAYNLKRYQKKRGIASICLGGGEACSVAIERV